MSRFLVVPKDIQGDRVVLGGRESHHLAHVLRFRAGDEVVVFDGAGNEYRCRVEELGKRESLLRVVEKLPSRGAARAAVALAHAVTRGERFDWVVEKGTELGVARVIPFSCERTAVKLDAKGAAKKAGRWRKLAEAAAKQCGRADVPAVDEVIPLDQLAGAFKQYDAVLLAYELEENRSLKSALRGNGAKKILAVVGPEGGFSSAEAKLLTASGAVSVSLGPNILRTETAAVAMLAMIFYELS